MDSKCSPYTKKGTQCTRAAISNGKCKTRQGEPDMLPLRSYPYKGECITITWCDRAENHVGMEIIGEIRKDVGDKFRPSYLEKLSKKYEGSELINLHDTKVKRKFRKRV